MIDTIKVIVNSSHLGNLPDLLSFDPMNGNLFNYNFKNIKIRIIKKDYNYTIIIEGSIHKYFKGNNTSDFKFDELKNAISNLSDELGLNINTGIVTRVDIGANIKLKHDPKLYNLCLYKGYRYVKHVINDGETVEFRKRKKSIIFYDKRKENIRNRYKNSKPSKIEDKNIIRYEMRLTKALADTLNLGKSHLYVSDLYRIKIYKRLVRLWFKEYLIITKITYSYAYPEDFKMFHKFIQVNGMIAIGPKILPTLIEVWSDVKDLPYGKRRYLRDSTKIELCKPHGDNELVIELNKKIKKIKKQVLSSI